MDVNPLAHMARSAALAAALFAAQALPGPSALPPGEASALRRLERPELETLRAGTVGEDVGLTGAERDALSRMRSSELEALRGGDVRLSDRDIRLILIAAGVVLLLVLIL